MSERWMTQEQAEGLWKRARKACRDSEVGECQSGCDNACYPSEYVRYAIAEATLRPGDVGWCAPKGCSHWADYEWEMIPGDEYPHTVKTGIWHCLHLGFREGHCPKEATGGEMTRIRVDFPYIGGVLSVNHCYWKGRHLRAEAAGWRNLLATKIRLAIREVAWELVPPIRVIVSGQFKDRRSTPDLHNIKLVADAVQMATELNDRDYEVIFKEPRVVKGCEPTIYIEISDAKEEGDAGIEPKGK